MARYLAIALMLYIAYRIFKMFMKKKKNAPGADTKPGLGEDTFRDPVCGVYVSEETAVIGRHDGERLHFCSMECLEKFSEQIATSQIPKP